MRFTLRYLAIGVVAAKRNVDAFANLPLRWSRIARE